MASGPITLGKIDKTKETRRAGRDQDSVLTPKPSL